LLAEPSLLPKKFAKGTTNFTENLQIVTEIFLQEQKY